MTQSTEFATAWAAVQKITDSEELRVFVATVTRMAHNRACSQFTWGKKVKFFAKGRWIEGTVETVNPKTIGVKTPTGPWRVQASLLYAA